MPFSANPLKTYLTFYYNSKSSISQERRYLRPTLQGAWIIFQDTATPHSWGFASSSEQQWKGSPAQMISSSPVCSHLEPRKGCLLILWPFACIALYMLQVKQVLLWLQLCLLSLLTPSWWSFVLYSSVIIIYQKHKKHCFIAKVPPRFDPDNMWDTHWKGCGLP